MKLSSTSLVRRIFGSAGAIIYLAMSLWACQRQPDPADTISDAYNWYVNTVKAGRNPLDLAQTQLKQFATDRFVVSLDNMRPEINDSPFSDRETFDGNLAIQQVTSSGQTASARVILAGRAIGKHNFNVYLVKEAGTWKIDDVKLLEEQ